MPSCIVPYCTSSSTGNQRRKSKFYQNLEKHMKLSFHKLPRNEKKRNTWLKSLQISGPIPKSGVVCSLHFNEQDFNRTLSKIYLRDEAVPSYYALDGKDKENAEIQYDDSIHDVSFSSLSSTDNEPIERLKDTSNHNISMDTHLQQDNDISAGEIILDEVTGHLITRKISVTKNENDVSLNGFIQENCNIIKSVTIQDTSTPPQCNKSDKETNCCLLSTASMQLECNLNYKERNSCLLVLLAEKERQLQMQRKAVKNLKRKLARKEKTITDLKDVIKSIDKKQVLNKYQLDNLLQLGESNKDILKRIINKNIGKPVSRQYPAELKSFALTLHCYSPRAYIYVQKKFNSLLPNPKTIYRWYRSEDSNPDDQTEEQL